MVSLRRSGRHTSKPSHGTVGPGDSQGSAAAGQIEVDDSLSQDVLDIDTLSTATLPPRYTVTVALDAGDFPLGADRRVTEYVRGEEALSDAWRRGDAAGEGLLEIRWEQGRGVKRRRLDRGKGSARPRSPVGEGTDRPDQDRSQDGLVPLWYTAGLSFPCTCELERSRHAHAPRYRPPESGTLHPLPGYADSTERPLHPAELPDWSTCPIGTQEAILDLEPALDQLKEFEVAWRDADGSWGRGWACDDLGDTRQAWEDHAGPSGIERDVYGRIASVQHGHMDGSSVKPSRTKGKGKAREIIRSETTFAVPTLPVQSTVKLSSAIASEGIVSGDLMGRLPASDEVTQSTADWQAESKRRKEVWRAMIRSDVGYGHLWDVIAWPQSYHALPSRDPPRRTTPASRYPDFILPRALSTTPNPFHPSLADYIAKHPHSRVHWIIPVHGPVLVPGINLVDSFSAIGAAGLIKSTANPLTPSSAILAEHHPPVDPATRPFPLLWTPSALAHFMTHILVPLHGDIKQPFGSLSIKLSGPKPDPFLDLVEALPPTEHAFEPLLDLTSYAVGRSDGTRPVRAECGDHLRVYVDARYALALRTWLYGVEIPSEAVGAKRAPAEPVDALGSGILGHTSTIDALSSDRTKRAPRDQRIEGQRLFKKTRLVLIGEKGEVLVVA